MTDVGMEALDLLTVKQVAERLNVCEKTVRRLVYAWDANPGTGLEPSRIGRRLLISPEAVIDYKKRLRTPAADAA